MCELRPSAPARPREALHVVVQATGDVIDVRPAHRAAPLDVATLECSRTDAPPVALLTELAELLDRLRGELPLAERRTCAGAARDILRARDLLALAPRPGEAAWVELWRATARGCWLARRWPVAESLVARVLRGGRAGRHSI